MHSQTDGAGTVADDTNAAYYYMIANSESVTGGVGILHFDSTKTPHDVIGYRRTARKIPTGSRNCGGGRTPWSTW
jgi:secreted PhoX family phosphatase